MQAPSASIKKPFLTKAFFGTYQTSGQGGSIGYSYDEIVFKTDQLYNQRAPELWITFSIATVFTLVALLQYVTRVRRFQKRYMSPQLLRTSSTTRRVSITLRTMISCYIDTDDQLFVISKYSAQSFWFLGGMQIDYKTAFYFMMNIFALESILDSLRVVLAYQESESLKEYIPTSDAFIKRKTSEKDGSLELKPTNVYEDLTRSYLVVFMVFVTQVLLISFTVTDIYLSPTMTCPDGTTGCPLVQTLGSWWVYVIGIFMALVYILGPKTAYGNSEQNPAFWLRLLLAAKKTGTAVVSWHDPIKEQNFEYKVTTQDWNVWLRFFMSFLVNGVGFHVLVHALPIQVAAQSSFLMVVYRSVGMMHLVDLDDTAGYVMRLLEGEDNSLRKDRSFEEPLVPKKKDDDDDISLRAQTIVDHAKAQLDALLAEKKSL